MGRGHGTICPLNVFLSHFLDQLPFFFTDVVKLIRLSELEFIFLIFLFKLFPGLFSVVSWNLKLVVHEPLEHRLLWRLFFAIRGGWVSQRQAESHCGT